MADSPHAGRDRLRTAATVLALTPPGPESLSGLLADAPTPPDRLIVVTVGDPPGAWPAALDAQPSLRGVPVAYVDVRTPTATTDVDGDGPQPVATVPSPADLGSLGTALTELLGAHDDRAAVVLSSLSDMLGYVDRELLFKFVFTLGERVRGGDTVAYYHLDPGETDEELRTLFAHCSEAVLTESPDGIVVENGRFEA